MDLNLKEEQLKTFVLCFTKDISKKNIQNGKSKNDEADSAEEIRILKALTDLDSIRINIQAKMGITISEEMMENYKIVAS